MTDLSKTRTIKSLTTANRVFEVVDIIPHAGNDYFEQITTTEKYGDMAMIIWYQCWRNKHVVREVNSLHVIDVEYFSIEDEPLPF